MSEKTNGSHNVYTTLGASNHTEKERQSEDYYATDSIAIDRLAKVFEIPHNIYECACGRGDLAEKLKELGHRVYSTDLIDRGYGEQVGVNFLELKSMSKGFSILTNPPYALAKEFVLKSLDLIEEGQWVIMLLRLNFLESKGRQKAIFSQYPPRYVFVCDERLLCAKNADFEGMKAGGGSAVAYAWFCWQKGFNGKPELGWC